MNSAGRLGIRAVIYAAGFATILLSATIAIDVVARKLFSVSIKGTDELSGYLLAIVSTAGFAYALYMRAHTRIDVLLDRVGPRLKTALNLAEVATMFAFACFAAWQCIDTLRDTIRFQSISTSSLRMPLWIPQSIWVVGMIAFAMTAFALFLRALLTLYRSPWTFNRTFGPPTVEEELDQFEAGLSAGDRAETGERPEPAR